MCKMKHYMLVLVEGSDEEHKEEFNPEHLENEEQGTGIEL